MNKHAAAGQRDEERIHELATGFAVGSLNDTELNELYDVLREQGPLQTTAVRACWHSLQTTVHMRATLSPQLPDTVRMRVADPDQAGFVHAVMRRIGKYQRRLAPIMTPKAGQTARSRRWLVVVFLALICAVGVMWWSRDSGSLAVVRTINGHAQQLGQVLTEDMALGSNLYTVSNGTHLTIELTHGAEIDIRGPVQFALHRDGVSITQGRMSIVTQSRSLALSLPDVGLNAAASSRLEVYCQEAVSNVVLLAGDAERIHGQQTEIMQLNHVYQDGHPPWPWTTSASAEIGAETIQLAGSASAATWSFSAAVTLAQGQSSMVMVDARDSGRTLRFEPGRVVITSATGDDQIIDVPGAPLAKRTLYVNRATNGRTMLRYAGYHLTVPLIGPPLELQRQGGASVNRIRYFDGPAP